MKFILISIILFISCAALAQNPIYKNHLGSENPKNFLIDEDSKKVDFIKVLKHNFNEKQFKKLNKDLPIMNEVLASKCFRTFMENRDLIQTNGKSPKEIVNHIRKSQIGIELKSYYKWKGAVGYTYPNTKKIWMNSYHHRNFNSCRSASNLAHEGSHKLGYGHDYYKTARRPYSVPYSINAAFKACCGRGLEPEKKLICRRSWRTLWLKKVCYEVKS